jgi:hypothetical protein
MTVDFQDFFHSSRTKPIYVLLGVQGAGTNLLSRILARMFNISMLHDQSLVVHVAKQLGHRPTSLQVAAAYQALRASIVRSELQQKFNGSQASDREFLAGMDRCFAAAGISTAAGLASFVYAYRAFRLGATEVGIKSDDLWAHASALDHVLPKRRIILLTRDFRDHVVSAVHKRFGPVEPVAAAEWIQRRFRYYEREYQMHRDGHHLRFEDLLGDPGRTIEHLGDRLGLASVCSISTFVDTFTFRPGRIGRWRTLPRRDLEWCETILRRELLEYGYGLATGAAYRPSRIDAVRVRLRDTLGRIRQKLTHYGRVPRRRLRAE